MKERNSLRNVRVKRLFLEIRQSRYWNASRLRQVSTTLRGCSSSVYAQRTVFHHSAWSRNKVHQTFGEVQLTGSVLLWLWSFAAFRRWHCVTASAFRNRSLFRNLGIRSAARATKEASPSHPD